MADGYKLVGLNFTLDALFKVKESITFKGPKLTISSMGFRMLNYTFYVECRFGKLS